MLELVFNAFKRSKSTHSLWIIWFALWLEASRENPSDFPLLQRSLSGHIDLELSTWRKSVEVLAKLGLVIPYMTTSRSRHDLIVMRTALPPAIAADLKAVADGRAKIRIGYAKITRTGAGDAATIDHRLDGEAIKALLAASGVVARHGVVRLPEGAQPRLLEGTELVSNKRE